MVCPICASSTRSGLPRPRPRRLGSVATLARRPPLGNRLAARDTRSPTSVRQSSTMGQTPPPHAGLRHAGTRERQKERIGTRERQLHPNWLRPGSRRRASIRQHGRAPPLLPACCTARHALREPLQTHQPTTGLAQLAPSIAGPLRHRPRAAAGHVPRRPPVPALSAAYRTRLENRGTVNGERW